jgi:Zn-dependent M28 family amino/carboxypeptidase
MLLGVLLGLSQFSIYASAESVRYELVPPEIVEARLKIYAGDDVARGITLKNMFASAGCDDQHLFEQAVKGSKQPNVICILPGNSDRIIIAGAHFDHVSAGDGVVDNWSGASLLPSLYQAIKIQPREHTYIFIGFTDEEKGEVGSRFYAQHMTKEQVALADAMVNMDTVGLGSAEIWPKHADKRLNGMLNYIAGLLKVPLTGVNVDQVGSTDSVQFEARKIPSITIHSLTQETWNAGILHTSKDQISAIHLDSYYQTYRLISAYLAFLDQTLPGKGSPAH